MAVVYTLLAAGNVRNRLQYNVTMAASDPEVLRDVFLDCGAAQVDLAKVLGEAAATDAAARLKLGLRQAADTAVADDGRIRITVVPNTAGLMPQVIGKTGTGRANLAITAAGAGAATQVLVTIELVRENMRADGGAL
jgi:hypothetical protein